jgi:hypothetical protein
MAASQEFGPSRLSCLPIYFQQGCWRIPSCAGSGDWVRTSLGSSTLRVDRDELCTKFCRVMLLILVKMQPRFRSARKVLPTQIYRFLLSAFG